MVQAIEADRKKQTRRLKGLEELNKTPDYWKFYGITITGDSSAVDIYPTIQLFYTFQNTITGDKLNIKCPFGEHGDVLWVRESYCYVMLAHAHDLLEGSKDHNQYVYKANVHPDWMEYAKEEYGYKWKPSIHMPKVAARYFLQIKNIRVERLQDISRKDAIEEGSDNILKPDDLHRMRGLGNWKIPSPFDEYQFGFLSIWTKINGCDSWLKNPWVWVIEFEKIEKPENFI
jgi:hypothetical protein